MIIMKMRDGRDKRKRGWRKGVGGGGSERWSLSLVNRTVLLQEEGGGGVKSSQ